MHTLDCYTDCDLYFVIEKSQQQYLGLTETINVLDWRTGDLVARVPKATLDKLFMDGRVKEVTEPQEMCYVVIPPECRVVS